MPTNNEELPQIRAEGLEMLLLGEKPTLTRLEVAERAGVPIELSTELWRLLGFPQAADDDIAFTEADVVALKMTSDLMRLGVVGPDSQAALVRTWARSFARLAEWQTELLAGIAVASGDPDAEMVTLSREVLPRMESLQSYIWRRHLASAANQQLAVDEPGSTQVTQAICFVDIVGYTATSKHLDEGELVSWIEHFENEVIGEVNNQGGRVIKTIGDEVLFVTDTPIQAVEAALLLTARGADESDSFPAVRAGVAYGSVVRRLGDVFGPTVNVAARLTSAARPSGVIVDAGVHDALCTDHGAEIDTSLTFRKLRRVSAKGYARLDAWVVRRTQSM